MYDITPWGEKFLAAARFSFRVHVYRRDGPARVLDAMADRFRRSHPDLDAALKTADEFLALADVVLKQDAAARLKTADPPFAFYGVCFVVDEMQAATHKFQAF